MTCRICDRFPVSTSHFLEISTSLARHGTLYVCREYEQFIEVIAEERSHRYIANYDAKRFYPDSTS